MSASGSLPNPLLVFGCGVHCSVETWRPDVRALTTSGMQQRLGTDPPLSDQSLGAYLMRLRDPKTGQPLPDERLLPHIGMICELHGLQHVAREA
jgi:hypothetical protein